ncbi:MAG TPA: alpha/beta fold hydrolase [Propionibacterium sp.]|nr:alpha/beta fold hydrolase [Propionibacterium sp.]
MPDIDVAMPDLPGHGENVERSLNTASALAVIGDAVGKATNPVVLAGHSLGGYLSALWAHRNPGRLSGSGGVRGRV